MGDIRVKLKGICGIFVSMTIIPDRLIFDPSVCTGKEHSQMVEAPITVNVAYDPEIDVWYVKASTLAGLNVEARLSISLSTNYPAPLPIFLKKAADFVIRIFR